MKKSFHLIIGSGALVIALSVFNHCTRSESNPTKACIKLQPAKITENKKSVTKTNRTIEIKSQTKTIYKPTSSSNIVIPGRTIKSAVFTPGIQNSISVEGVKLIVPQDAISQTKNLSVIGLLAKDLPPIPSEITNVTKDYPGYRFLPHGTLFNWAATIAMTYDETLIPEGYTSEDIYTYYFDETDHKWKALERDSINHKESLIVSNTLHFTDMINGVIQVPESPVTEGYAPTTIKDIKAADPTTGITLIAPPSANNEGNAEMSFPFKLPAGRAGTQPELMLQYSIEGNSSWAGYGWNLTIPNISVDITWGAPRYESLKESETYLLAGTQLTPVAHRSKYINRTEEKRFYPRIEGEFNKIIRHGNKPNNYWWEVTSKNGEKNFYGGLPEIGFISSAVTTDAKGNIGNWALTQTRDVHDNRVNYKYDKPTECGQQLYISEITYTGHGDKDGPYKVTFLRNDESNTYQRKDARINAKMGFIQRDSALLRRVNVTFNDSSIRSYTLYYKEGAFLKTLLESITELDAKGKEFYTHKFEYYDDVQANRGYIPFKTEKPLTLVDDTVENPSSLFFNNVSALGGSASNGGGGKLTLTVGPNSGAFKDVTAGGGVGYNRSVGNDLLALVDIDGDGMVDKVYKKGDKIYYRQNIQSERLYGDEHEIKGIDNFGLSETNGISGGPEANPPFSYVSYDHSRNKTKTKVYFTDFNGDGLVDLAKKGVVYFNHIDTITNETVFEAISIRTPNPLNGTSNVDPSLLPDAAAEQAELEKNFPLHDAVRIWMAPYSGFITINAPVQLLRDPSKDAVRDTMKDGVKISIQYEGAVLWENIIDTSHYELIKHPDFGLIQVNKGQRLFFRVQSRFNGSYDKVKWDPEINYTSITQPSINTLAERDVNNKRITRFKASEDFILKGAQSVGLSKKGNISILTTFQKPITTDSVRLEIIKTDSLKNQTILFSSDLTSNAIFTKDSINRKNIPVDRHDNLLFKVISSSNIDWSAIKWDIYLKYTSFADTSMKVTNRQGKPIFEFKPTAEFIKMYNDPIRIATPTAVDTNFLLSLGFLKTNINSVPHIMEIKPVFQYIALPFGVNDTLMLTVKTKKKLLGKRMYFLYNNLIVGNNPIYADIALRDTLYFEYHCVNRQYINNIGFASVSITYNSTINRDASVSYIINPENEIFGHLYRGWGQFDYFGNNGYGSLPIILSELRINPESLNNNATNVNTTDDLNSQHNPVGDIFNVAIPYESVNGYMGVDEMVYVSDSTMSSSRMGMKDVYVPPYNFSGGASSGLPAFDKITIENSDSYSGGLSGAAGSLIGSYSTSDVYFETDMADMNGDGYPDLISEKSIQYTGVLGGLDGSAVAHDLGPHKASASAFGGSLGGGSVTAKCINSLVSKIVKNDKKGTQKAQQNDQKAKDAEETAEVSIGFSGNLSENTDINKETWLDINGDGLPDKLWNNGKVSLNLGYSFATAEDWHFPAIREGLSIDMGLGGSLGYSYKNRSISGGVGLSRTTNEATKAFLDVNGDGLPDVVEGNQVRFNTGSGFSDPITWSGLDKIDAGESIGENANFAFTISIPIWIIKICINPSGTVSTGVCKNITQLTDMDGDGMPDVLYSEKEGELKIKSSTINRTNMLKAVYRPMGSNFTLDYIQTPGTYKHPGGTWALASVKSFDGLAGDGVDTTFTTFEYEDGYYNRHERQFYGFATVKTNFHDTGNGNKIYRTAEQQFSNHDYYKKGMMLKETLLDGNGNKQTGSENIYVLRNINTGERLPDDFAQNDSTPAFVALEEIRQYLYEGASSSQITTRTTFSYDKMGKIIEYTDFSTGLEKDKINVAITYHSDSIRYIYSVPSSHTITTAEGLMRKRETSINEYGDIIQIKQLISDGQSAVYDMEYDEYGSLTKVAHPANYKGERMWYAYEYDTIVHSFITKITDAYGYSSSSAYNYKWGTPIESTDMNNQKMLYTYDHCGRSTTITGPYEIALNKDYTIKYEYHPEAVVPYARTLHYDSLYNNIETYSFTDGEGRAVQVKKTALLFENESADDKSGFMVSGKAIYDAFGRVVKTYQPIFEDSTNPTSYNASPDVVNPNLSFYDVLDRTIMIALPDGAKTKRSFSIGAYNGEIMHIDTLIDALGHSSVTITDPKNQSVATILKSSSGDIITSMEYNTLGELITVTDPKGSKTTSVHDKLGRRTSINYPNAGLTEIKYDAAGNVIKKITQTIRNQMRDTGAIIYHYDRERLLEIVYPRNVQNRVNYTYGAPGAPHNRSGRTELVQDASGGQEFFYGPLGEIIKTIRTVQLGESDMRTWIWGATYDTWNRAQTMTYPDGEKVRYTYNPAGNLTRMDGEKLGRSYLYISRIGYDKTERQVYLQYGNGAVTTYNYELERRRLAQMSIQSNNALLMDNTYKYDVLNNILGITNSTAANGAIGGSTSHTYSYDDINQLKQASGIFTGNKDTSRYTLAMQYDIMGNILHKTQTHYTNNVKQTATTYDFGYGYNGLKPNLASQIGEKTYTYDGNGNQISWEDTITHDFRQLYWDEENRLTLISDNGYLNNYVYDASGERVIKSQGGSQGVFIDGAPAGILNHSDNNYTIYVSPLFVLQNERFTKHYYAGSTRVISKIGNGRFENQYRPGVFEMTAGKVNYINRQQQIYNSVEDYIDSLDVPPGPPTLKGIYADPAVSHYPYPDAGTPDTIAPRGWPRKTIFAPAAGPPGAPVQWGNDITNDNVEPGFGYIGNGNIEENLSYFYHSDHLGSTNYITDLKGNINQFISYMPFGETLAEQHSYWDSPYKFNAKESDAETGLYYYGARYYDPKISRWLSVDPMFEKYRAWSPYTYSLNNSVRFTDPDGTWIPDADGNLIAEKGDNASSLANFMGVQKSEAKQMLQQQGYRTSFFRRRNTKSLTEGSKVELKNVFTESIGNSTSHFTTDVMQGYAPRYKKFSGMEPVFGDLLRLPELMPAIGPGIDRGTPEDNYNCWGSAIAGSLGKKIGPGVGIKRPEFFDSILESMYTPTNEKNAKFGKTVLRFADEKGTQHGAVFYGKSKDGTIYVYSKNGWHAKPEVMKLEDLKRKIPSYGNVNGYFNSK